MTTLTDAVYWASKSLAIKAMVAAIKVAQSGKSAWTANAIALAAAQQLALAGHVDQADLVDVPIMVWGWDPLLTMQTRISYGYTWVPSALAAPIEIAPGLIVPGVPSYSASQPEAGYIKVSIDAADYPVYV
jgi:hypothetical protein